MSVQLLSIGHTTRLGGHVERSPFARVGASRAATPQGQAAGEGCANSRPRIVRGAIRGEATARADERTEPLSTGSGVMLVGDGIENPANALTMIHAAAMFGARCRFRDTKGLAESGVRAGLAGEMFSSITGDEIQALHSRIIAFDNLPGAREVYGFHAGRDFAVLMGNERRGLSHEFTSLATDGVQVPLLSRRINCLNVAAASAVALYYLCAPPVGSMEVRKDPRTRRPELLLLGAGDHFELGSTIRSAAGLGWERAFIEDRHQVWFGCDRAVRSEGRAAARRGRNTILLIPCRSGVTHSYPRVMVITCKQCGVPLHRANLT